MMKRASHKQLLPLENQLNFVFSLKRPDTKTKKTENKSKKKEMRRKKKNRSKKRLQSLLKYLLKERNRITDFLSPVVRLNSELDEVFV